MQIQFLVGLALVGMASVSSAQANTSQNNSLAAGHSVSSGVLPVGVTPQHYNLNYVTGVLTKTVDKDAKEVGVNAASSLTYDNTCPSGFFTTITPGSEFLDWGDKTGLSGVVTSFDIGYGTLELDPSLSGPGASMDVTFYSGTTGSGTAGLGAPIATFSFTGLPGSSVAGGVGAFVVTVDLTGGAEICLPDGDIGYSYCSFDAAGTGPLLVDVTACLSNGIEDAFDIYTCPAATGTYVGTFSFTTPLVASFYMAISEDDGTEIATTVLNNGSGINPILTSDGGVPPVLGAVWPAMVDNSAGHATSVLVLSLSSLPAGSVVTAGGELIADPTGGYFITSVIVGTGMVDHSMLVPKDVTLLGVDFTAQGANLFGLPFVLTNALDIHIGF